MTRKDFAIFDGDSHAVEPPELWEKYLEPEDRTLGKHGLWRQEAGSPEPGAGAPAHSPKPSPRGGSSGFPGSRAPGSGFSSRKALSGNGASIPRERAHSARGSPPRQGDGR
jgi:hypothetical protein